MHPISLEYLTNLKQHHAFLNGKLTLTPPPEHGGSSVETAHSALVNYIGSTFGEDIREELAAHSWDMDYWLSQLEQRLYEDLEDYCTETERAVLRQAAIAYLPLKNANAFAGHVPDEPLSHVIVVHLSLIWVSFQLTEALLLAAQQQYESAGEAYRAAMRGYRKSRFLDLFNEWRESTVVADDRLLAETGAVSTVILRFVGLHELGHLVLGHVEKAGMCYASETGKVEYARINELGQSEAWALEYAADRFAVDHLLACTGGLEQMWNNILFIGAFFRFIEHADLLHGASAGETHPPPAQRLQALAQRVTDVLGPPPNEAQRWAEEILMGWRNE